jgi:DNA-binding NarL/FixJ family response regulator
MATLGAYQTRKRRCTALRAQRVGHLSLLFLTAHAPYVTPLRARELQPDLILLDLAMPRLNGAELAGILKQEMLRVKIILFTMYTDQFGEELASSAGIHLVLSKPEGMSVLSGRLKALLNPTDEPPALS